MELLCILALVAAIGLTVGQQAVLVANRPVVPVMVMFRRDNIQEMLKMGINIAKLAKLLKIPKANQIDKLLKASNFDKISKMFQNLDVSKLLTPQNLMNLATNGINFMELAKMLKVPGADQLDSLMKG